MAAMKGNAVMKRTAPMRTCRTWKSRNRNTWVFLAIGCLPALLLSGCGQSSNSSTANTSPAVSEAGDSGSADSEPKPNEELQALLQDKQATPDAIVKAFLDAAKSSDRAFAEQLQPSCVPPFGRGRQPLALSPTNSSTSPPPGSNCLSRFPRRWSTPASIA
mgnify:CR=1 FL=1